MQRISRKESKALTDISKRNHTIGTAKDTYEAEKRLMELEEGGHAYADDSSSESLASNRSEDLIGKCPYL